MSKTDSSLPLEIAMVTRKSLLPALDSVRGCLKATSMLWMHTLGVNVLPGIVVNGWSKRSAAAVGKFCRGNRFSELLLRIDKPYERWSRRRGGFLIDISRVSATVKELRSEGRIAILLEPASPYSDEYSLTGVTIPETNSLVAEVVGPGFDTSDILRGDIEPHERWQLKLERTAPGSARASIPRSERTFLTTPEGYVASFHRRLEKVGARIKDPSFPDSVIKSSEPNLEELSEKGEAFLKDTRQTALLKHARSYAPIPRKHLVSFARNVQKVLSGLADYGIHLGSTSFAASVLPKRGLVFWDFFPARRDEAELLYPSASPVPFP